MQRLALPGKGMTPRDSHQKKDAVLPRLRSGQVQTMALRKPKSARLKNEAAAIKAPKGAGLTGMVRLAMFENYTGLILPSV